MTNDDITRLLLAKLPAVKAVTWRQLGMGQQVAQLQFKWYAWITLDPFRAKHVHLAHVILDDAGVTNVLVTTI
jgi:hypothetical protein